MQKLDKKQIALLFHLMFFEETLPILSKFKPQVSRKPAMQLEDMKLIRIERTKRGQFTNISLTDYAWEWISENFAYPKSKPQAADYAFERFFVKICRLQKNDGLFFSKLAALLNEAETTSMDDVVVRAYLAASGGNFCELVAISDIRKNMPSNTRESLNDALLSMMRAKKLDLNVQGNPAMLKEEDRENPVFVGGQPRHAVYIGGNIA